MIYAVGPDDRYTPKAPAYDFFHFRLVDSVAKVFRAAEKAGVKKAVVYNSYFAYFDRKYPEMCGYSKEIRRTQSCMRTQSRKRKIR